MVNSSLLHKELLSVLLFSLFLSILSTFISCGNNFISVAEFLLFSNSFNLHTCYYSSEDELFWWRDRETVLFFLKRKDFVMFYWFFSSEVKIVDCEDLRGADLYLFKAVLNMGLKRDCLLLLSWPSTTNLSSLWCVSFDLHLFLLVISASIRLLFCSSLWSLVKFWSKTASPFLGL